MKEKSGLCLSVSADGRERKTDIFAYCLTGLLCLSAAAAVSSFFDFLPMLLGALAVCFVYFWLKHKKKTAYFLPMLLPAAVLLLLLAGKELQNEACTVLNRLRAQLAEKYGVLLPLRPENSEKTVLLSVLSGALLGSAGCFSGKRAPLSGCIFLIAAAAASLLLGNGAWGAVLCLLCAAVLLAGRADASDKRKILRHTAAGILIFAAITAVFSLPFMKPAMQRLRQEVREGAHALWYENGAQVLPEGRLDRPLPPQDSEKTLLTLRVSEPQTLYLRGFTGMRFESGVWSGLPLSDLAEQKELIGALHEADFFSAAQFAAAQACVQSGGKITVEVQNRAACSAYRYYPYQLTADGSELQKARLDGTAAGGNQNRVYQYAIAADADGQIENVLTALKTQTDEKTNDFLRQESAYRAFITPHALAVPQEFTEQYAQRLEACRRDTAQTSALAFIKSLSGESGGSVYDDASVTVLALRYYGIPARYAEGFTVQKDDFSAQNVCDVTAHHAGAWAEVYQDGIGWLPIACVTGFGGSAGQSADGDAENGGQSKTHAVRTADSVSEEQQPQEELSSAQPRKTAVPFLRGAVLWALGIALLLVLAIAAVILRRQLILRRKNRLFTQSDPAEALAWLFADCAGLLEAIGISRNGGSLLKLQKRAAEKLGEEYGAAFSEMAQLNEQALFSSRTFTEQQRTQMREFHEKTCAMLRQNTTLLQRVHLRLVKCLY